jgi:hypothetical protein
MKFKQSLAFGATASLATLLTISSVVEIGNANPSTSNKQETHTTSLTRDSGTVSSVPATITIAQLSGNFVAAEAPTTGMATIVEENGQKYLEIDSAFSTTDQAPDLQVLLDTVAEPPANYQDTEANRYLNLGGLQSVTGEQRYPIPEFVDETQFQSVVIWCRTANATMGYAALAADTDASIK